MDWLLNLIPGGGLTALVGGLVAALGIVWRLLARERKAGRDEQKVDEYERHLEDLARVERANRARPTDSVLDDPNNRDTWKK